MSPNPKAPPYSIEAEQSVLGGLMLDNRAWNDVAEQLSEIDFYRADHRVIWRAISDLNNTAQPCDFVTISEYLRARNLVEDAGGISYLGSLANDTPSAANVMAYAEIVRERSVLRQLIGMGGDIAEMGYRPEGRDTATLLDAAEQQVFKLREQGAKARSDFVDMPEVLRQVFSRIETVRANPLGASGLSTGFTEFDHKTTGLGAGDLMILAARPSMGKCLAEDAEIVLDDGSIATMAELHHRRGLRVGTLRADLKLDRAEPSDYVDDGQKPVFEVTTRLGRRVETTLTHPFLTLDGWKPLSEIQPGDHIAVPRALPVFGTGAMRECEVKLLAYLIGDGGLTGTSPRFTTTNPAIERDFHEAVAAFGGCVCTPYRSETQAASFAVVADRAAVVAQRGVFAERLDAVLVQSGRSARAVATAIEVLPSSLTFWRRGKSVPDANRLARLCAELKIEASELAADGARHNAANPITAWLRTLGLDGHGAATKHVPAPVFRLPREQLALFLRHLFATDGWATVLASGQSQIGYASVSERLARQVTHLLLRFGVIAKVRLRWVKYRETRRPSWQVDITDGGSIRRFVDEIGIFAKEAAVERVRDAVARRREQTNTDLIPKAVWRHLEQAKGSMSWAELARRAGVTDSNIHVGRRALSRPRLARFAMVLGDTNLAVLANSDVYWDRVESIVPAGVRQVYDLTMPVTHNFVANDVCVHNTSFAVNIAEHVAFERKQPVAIFSMEMSAEQIGFRIISSRSGIPLQKLKSGNLNDTEMDALTWTIGRLREAPLFIDEQGGLSPQTLRAKARRLAMRHHLALMVVDYIQLMSVPALAGKRVEEVSEISRQLKALAKELKIPIIALSQLNRGLENRDDKRPRMADLRESGGIEQDADLIVFIFREWVYDKSKDETAAEIIIAKQRNGATGSFPVQFIGANTKFDNPTAPGYGQ
ncbi:MAG TPA: replicative DNA helicase [Nevskiaceae bacterium]|nr:replicative DNA helicase [Nevskiaceae bacterium]